MLQTFHAYLQILTRQLQVEVSNWLNEFDKKNTADSVTRLKVEGLLFEASYKFIVNKNWEHDEFRALEEFCATNGLRYEVLAVSLFTKQMACRLR